MQAEAIYDRLAETATLETAEEWQAGLGAVFASLATLPERCLEASEDRFYQRKHPGPVLRVRLYRWGRSAWRVLFTVHAATSDDPPSVIVRLIGFVA